MAIKTFIANLNGGDVVTPDNDLIYKIYGLADSYTTPIITTGSHNSDANVTVTAGTVTITNVDVGAETIFKISSVDQAANESILSAAFSAFLFSDDFAGTVIDVSKWTVSTPDPNASITQNEVLTLSVNGTATGNPKENNVNAAALPASTEKYVTMDYANAAQAGAGSIWFGIHGDADPTVNSNQIGVLLINATQISISVKQGGASVNQYVTLDVSTAKTLKIKITATTIDFYYWNGSSWAQLGTQFAFAGFATYRPGITIRDTLGAPETYTIDNFVVTDIDFSTQRP